MAGFALAMGVGCRTSRARVTVNVRRACACEVMKATWEQTGRQIAAARPDRGGVIRSAPQHTPLRAHTTTTRDLTPSFIPRFLAYRQVLKLKTSFHQEIHHDSKFTTESEDAQGPYGFLLLELPEITKLNGPWRCVRAALTLLAKMVPTRIERAESGGCRKSVNY